MVKISALWYYLFNPYVYAQNEKKCIIFNVLGTPNQLIENSSVRTHILRENTSTKDRYTFKISSETNASVKRSECQKKPQKMSFFDRGALRKNLISREQNKIFWNGFRRNSSNTFLYSTKKYQANLPPSIEQLIWKSVVAYPDGLIYKCIFLSQKNWIR